MGEATIVGGAGKAKKVPEVSGVRVKAPDGVTSAWIDGAEVSIPKDGIVTVSSDAAAVLVLGHGFAIV